MLYRRTPAIFLTLAVLAVAALAEQPIEDHPGFFPFEDLELFPRESANIEVNLQGGLLRLVAAAIGSEEPAFAELVSGLRAIRVLVADLDGLDQETLQAGAQRGAQRLESEGWLAVVRVREEGEQVYIYAREKDGDIEGLTVLSVEQDEAVLINLVGRFDPERLLELGSALDLPSLEKAVGRSQSQEPPDEP